MKSNHHNAETSCLCFQNPSKIKKELMLVMRKKHVYIVIINNRANKQSLAPDAVVSRAMEDNMTILSD